MRAVAVPGVPLAQADLNRNLPLRRRTFDGFLCTLVSEHLENLRTFFAEAFSVVRKGGRLVFSAFHPEAARAGVEAPLLLLVEAERPPTFQAAITGSCRMSTPAWAVAFTVSVSSSRPRLSAGGVAAESRGR